MLPTLITSLPRLTTGLARVRVGAVHIVRPVAHVHQRVEVQQAGGGGRPALVQTVPVLRLTLPVSAAI